MLQIKDIKIRAAVEENLQSAFLEVSLCANGEEDAEPPVFLCAQLLAADGSEADRILPVRLEQKLDFRLQAEPVHLWDMERAYLYDLVLELRDEKMQLLGCTVKKTAFYRWEEKDGVLYLNGKKPRLRVICAPDGWENYTEEQICAWLAEAKRNHYNAVAAADLTQISEERKAMCLQYGIWPIESGQRGAYNVRPIESEQHVAYDARLTESGQHRKYGVQPIESGQRGAYDIRPIEKTAEEPTEFELSVMREGVLVENHCVYASTSEYLFTYSLSYGGKTVCEGCLETDVPPGMDRYVEVPYPAPEQTGEYTYRAALCLKKDMPWAQRGFEVAHGETVLYNMYETPAQE